MDPLLIEALRFGTAILAGGIVAVIAQRIAFGYAQRARREERDVHDAALQRALQAELGENIERCDRRAGTRAPRRTERSAWDGARALPLPDVTFDLLAEAYALGTELNSHIDIVDASRARGLPAPTVFDHDYRKQLHDSAVDASHRAADEAHAAFTAAGRAFA